MIGSREGSRIGEFLEYAANIAFIPHNAELSSILCTPSNVSLGFDRDKHRSTVSSWAIQILPIATSLLAHRSSQTSLITEYQRTLRSSVLRSVRFPLFGLGIGELARIWVTRAKRNDEAHIQETIPLEFAKPLGEYSIVHGPSNPYDGLNQIMATIDRKIGQSTLLARELATPEDAKPFFIELLEWQAKRPPKFANCTYEQHDSETDSTVLLTPNQQRKLRRHLAAMASPRTEIDILNSSDHMYGDDLTVQFRRPGFPAHTIELRGPHRRADFLRPEPIAAFSQALLCLQSVLPEEGGIPLRSSAPGALGALAMAFVTARQAESIEPWKSVCPMLVAPIIHGLSTRSHSGRSSISAHAPIAPAFGVSAISLALVIRNTDILTRKEATVLVAVCLGSFGATQSRYLRPGSFLGLIRTCSVAFTLVREGVRLLDRLDTRQKPEQARHTEAWRKAFLVGRHEAIGKGKADCKEARRRIHQAELSGTFGDDIIQKLRATLREVENELHRDELRRYR
jgi:hypothetical protein